MSFSETYTVRLVLVVPCSTCMEARSVQGSATCPVCGNLLPADLTATVRDSVRRRRQAFKGRLGRLERRMHEVTDGPLTFATRGVPLGESEHLTKVLRPATVKLEARHQTLKRILATGTWDPSESGCINDFNELVGTLDTGLTFVTELREVMPPIEWRAVHRELVRAAAQQVRGQVSIALTISAPDADAAMKLQETGNRSFAAGASHAERANMLIELARRAPSDGPFQPDGSLDIAALTWASVGEESVSIANGSEVIRNAFADVPGMSTAPDEYAVMLLPLLAQAARIVDHETLVERTRQLRAVLDAADASSAWLSDASLLVSRVQRGLDRITNEAARLGREWRHGLPRGHVMNSLTEVYRQLVEGALRDIGGIILIATRAGRNEDNGVYEQEVTGGIKAGEIVTELERIGTPCGGAVNMLYRNASAHADIEVTDTGIMATTRVIENGRVTDSATKILSDAEFSEEVVALHEILLALQLAVLPWLWSHPAKDVVEALRVASPTPEQRSRVLALLAGMAGLHDVSVATDGRHVTISAALREDAADRREIGILSVVVAAFGATPGVAEVTVHVANRHPVTFKRAEFVGSEDDGTPHGLTMLGLTTAKWLVGSGAGWTDRDEATYVTFPLTRVHFGCMRLAGSTPHSTENIDKAVESARLVRARLDELLAPKLRSSLTRRAIYQLDTMAASLMGLTESRRGLRSSAEAQILAQKAAATHGPMYQVQEEAKAIRDRQP